jgi:NAD(P)H-dependent flavin oxidoreductase YrpB (nitropropane dioxygenase family)
MTPALLDTEIAATKALTDKPFGVNLITLHPAMLELIAVCAKHKVSHIVLAGGLPSGAAIEAIKAAGAKLMCFAPTAALAKKLVRSGVDAIVIEGSEAGGHIGPVSLGVLAQEILPVITEVPVFVAGGIGRGTAIAAWLEMGASGVQLGTRFAASAESVAHPNFKKAFFRASARDAVASVQLDPRLPVIPVRALKNAGTEAFTAKQREIADGLGQLLQQVFLKHHFSMNLACAGGGDAQIDVTRQRAFGQGHHEVQPTQGLQCGVKRVASVARQAVAHGRVEDLNAVQINGAQAQDHVPGFCSSCRSINGELDPNG